ncbi:MULTISPECIES: HWE histidine kinase domain-containing protein [Methylobacterium]|nr:MULTISPECIES: HWE histidine kinase domain-containing protein [Methylobacterium]UIN36881.1 hypothetical protein LXM90_10430 [Methylobacterium oryzae]
MVRELHHRVKNTLATVQAVLNATLRSAVSLPEFGRAFSGGSCRSHGRTR